MNRTRCDTRAITGCGSPVLGERRGEIPLRHSSATVPATSANALLADKARIPAQQTIVDNAVQVQESIQENLNASLRQAKAVASGSATAQARTHQSTINPLTVESLAETVQAIAASAINRPCTSDVCLDILKVAGGESNDQRQQSPPNEQYLDAVDQKTINLCIDILSDYQANDSDN